MYLCIIKELTWCVLGDNLTEKSPCVFRMHWRQGCHRQESCVASADALLYRLRWFICTLIWCSVLVYPSHQSHFPSATLAPLNSCFCLSQVHGLCLWALTSVLRQPQGPGLFYPQTNLSGSFTHASLSNLVAFTLRGIHSIYHTGPSLWTSPFLCSFFIAVSLYPSKNIQPWTHSQ